VNKEKEEKEEKEESFYPEFLLTEFLTKFL
jgi:hypothetical protein